jgi:ABC-type transporter Mla subunit MlaD
VGRIFGATEELVRRLSHVDLEGFVTHVNDLAMGLTTKIDELQFGRLSGEVVGLVSELRQTNRKLQRLLDDPQLAQVPGDLAKTTRDSAVVAARLRRLAESDDLQKTLTQLQQTLARLDRMIAGRENDVATTLNNLRQITDNLRDLSEDAKRYPSGVIFGQPPKRDVRAK